MPQRNGSISSPRTPRKTTQVVDAVDSDRESDSDSDFELKTVATRLRRSRISPEVIAPSPSADERSLLREYVLEDDAALPQQTPTTRKVSKASSSAIARRPNAIHEYQRPNDNLMLTYEQLQQTKEPIQAIAEDIAHPSMAGTSSTYLHETTAADFTLLNLGLLFRYSDS